MGDRHLIAGYVEPGCRSQKGVTGQGPGRKAVATPWSSSPWPERVRKGQFQQFFMEMDRDQGGAKAGACLGFPGSHKTHRG